ncbi:MAG TPA: DinB family protein [Acetobacteraceae bacterium]|nr:DinB family protein [Acetobacteraceae bacterium]
MITPAYVRTLAAYNSEMNRRLYAAAARIPDAERKADRGAFWKSIHGTLVHLLWGDQVWMARFDGWQRPAVPIGESAGMVEDFATLADERVKADAGIEAWAGRVTDAWLAEDLVWFSGASQRQRQEPRVFVVTHFFNHQTHHRGQAHALITASGQPTGDTDLMIVVDGLR